MRLKTLTAAVALMLAGSNVLASNTDTLPEENRGAITGLVVGASVGGPIGAGLGAIIGGGLVGKLVGVSRVNTEMSAKLLKDASEQAMLNSQVKDLGRDLDRVIKFQSENSRDRELSVQFRTGSAQIEPHYRTQLDKVADVLARNKSTRIDLSGFADRRGDEAYNQKLSEDRVTEVRQYLLSRGVSPDQVYEFAHGEKQPLHTEESPEAHFFDRRVVVQFSLDPISDLATR